MTAQNPESRISLDSILLSFGTAVLIFGLLGRSLSLWSIQPEFTVLFSSKVLASAAALLALLALACFKRGTFQVSTLGFGTGLLVVFFSDWLVRSYSFLGGSLIRGEIILFALVSFALIRSKLIKHIDLLLPILILGLIYTFISLAAGRPISTDDHPTFMYRMMLLKQNFPFIPFYNPLWNGGIDARDFFATGALNVFLITSPLIYLFKVELIYNFLVAFILFVFVPAATYAACRIEQLERPAPGISAILALCNSLLWYRWGLKYGTLGFITTTALIPLCLALASKIIARDRKLGWYDAVLFVTAFSLMLMWSPSGLVFLPVILIGAMRSLVPSKKYGSLLRKRLVAPIVVAVIAINLPWIGLFWSVSNVGKFLKSEKPSYQVMHESTEAEAVSVPSKSETKDFKHKKSHVSLSESLKILRETAVSTNPLIILFLLPGIVLLRKDSRVTFGATLLWLLFLGSFLVPVKPQLELDRMLIVLGLLACLPSGAAISRLLLDRLSSQSARPTLQEGIASLCGGFLIAGMFSTAAIVDNRSVEQYFFSEPIVSDITSAIRSVPADGRILFSGFVLHDLSHGHVAPLALTTKRALIASSPVHNQWRYRQIFPSEFLERDDSGAYRDDLIQRYLDLYNVAAVISHEREWRQHFESHPERYKLVWRSGRFSLFTRSGFTSNYFLEGSGTIVSQSSNQVVLRTDTPDAVVKFNYLPFLESSSCQVSEAGISDSIEFVKLTACPVGVEISLHSEPGYLRLFK